MCPRKTFAHLNAGAKIPNRQTGVSQAFSYTLPILRENNSGWFIEFYAFDPEQGQMRRKRIKINRIKHITKRRQYAREVINRLIDQLRHGWNPWVIGDCTDLELFEDALSRYEQHIEKMIANGYFRRETYAGYKSSIKILRLFVAEQHPIYYAYQFDRRFCVDFLDYVFISRNNSAQTRNNYLNFLRVLSGFFVEKGILQTKPTDGISPISKRLYKKERECIPADVVAKIAEYCKQHDPHFLFACYLLYYCFIRPIEMTRLKVEHFNLKNGTITIPAELSKNKTTQRVTLPKKVILYGIELGIFSAPLSSYIFSIKLRPGDIPIDTKIFRDHWSKVRKVLKLKDSWQFYSLKDTGITEMCDKNMTIIAVRDQARHSSLAITDIYTRHADTANKDIFEFDGSL